MHRFSIRISIPLITLLIVAISLGLAYSTSRSLAHQQVVADSQNAMRERLATVQSIAEQLIQLGLSESLVQLVSSYAAEQDLRRLIITDENGTIKVSNHFSEVGRHWSDIDLGINIELVHQAINNNVIAVQNNPVRISTDGVTRICHYHNALATQAERCGLAFYRTDLDQHYAQVDRQLYQQSSLIGAEILLGSIILLALLSVILTRPALRMERALGEFNKGDRAIRINVIGNNELSKLGRQINQLFQQIQRNEKILAEKQERLRATLDAVSDSIITINEKGIIVSANPATEVLFQYTTEEILGRDITMLMSKTKSKTQDGSIWSHITSDDSHIIGNGRDVEAQRKNGENFPVHLSLSEMRVDGNVFFIASIQDITEREQLQQSLISINNQLLDANLSLHESAITDGLTGLFNRKRFDGQLEEELRRACRNKEPLSLLICDIDYFKQYNDNLGHQAGDQCLQSIARLFTQVFQRAGEFTARYGGEEFVIILPHQNTEQAIARAAQLQQVLNQANIPHGNSSVADRITLSIGIACYIPGQNHARPIAAAELLKYSDQALYLAKGQGRNQIVCESPIKDPLLTAI